MVIRVSRRGCTCVFPSDCGRSCDFGETGVWDTGDWKFEKICSARRLNVVLVQSEREVNRIIVNRERRVYTQAIL